MSSTITHLPPLFSWLGMLVLSVLVIGAASIQVCRAQGSEVLDDPVAIFNQAQDAHEKGDLAGAIKLYEKALKIMPEFPEAEYQRGIALLVLKNTDEAEKAFRRAVEIKPDWTLAMTSLGSLLVQKGKMAEAEPILKKVVEIEPQNSQALIALSDLRRKAGSSPEALQQILASMTTLTAKANPTASLWSARADIEIALGKAKDAKTSVAQALTIDPKYRFAHFQAASLALADGDIVRAKQAATTIQTLSPETDSLNLLRANIAASEGDLEEAVKFLDAIKIPGTEASDFRNKINAARTTNPAELEKLLTINAKDPVVLGKLCSLLRKDDPAKAIEYCRRAAEAEPTNMNHAVGYGAALVQAKQYDGAVNIFRKIVEIVPENWTAHANLATALFQLKRLPEAKVEYEWLTSKQPLSPTAFFFLAIVHDQLDEYMDAMANYQQYLKLADPVQNKLDIDKVNLRLPSLQRQIKEGKGKKNE